MSWVANVAAAGARAAADNKIVEIVATVGTGLIIAGLAWAIVRGAAVADAS